MDLDLSNDLTVSVLFLFGVSTLLLQDCDFSVLLTMFILFVVEILGLMDSSTTFFFNSFLSQPYQYSFL